MVSGNKIKPLLYLNDFPFTKNNFTSNIHQEKHNVIQTSWIPTNLEMRFMSIIFTSNLSLELSSCFSSFSAKSRKESIREVHCGSMVRTLSNAREKDSKISNSGVAVPEITLPKQDGKNSKNDKKWKDSHTDE